MYWAFGLFDYIWCNTMAGGTDGRRDRPHAESCANALRYTTRRWVFTRIIASQQLRSNRVPVRVSVSTHTIAPSVIIVLWDYRNIHIACCIRLISVSSHPRSYWIEPVAIVFRNLYFTLIINRHLKAHTPNSLWTSTRNNPKKSWV